MICPRCSSANFEGSRFCEECGTPLERACPSCGTACSPRARFCRECGTAVDAADRAPDPRSYTPKHLADKILQSKSAIEGERKQVTVLFADIKGSMELQEGIDPEDWHGIMDRFFQILTEGVHRFEGTVNQYTGDGIMALFGAPIAHEDHARRGCYAALRLRDEVREYADGLRVERGLNFGVRIGLNSGEVVVGKIGDDLRMDYTAQGHTVGLAHRMEQLAESGRICLSEHTARLAEGYFELRDLGASKIKGLGEPLRLYELEGVGAMRTRLDVSRARGFSRFVGRDREVGILEGALEQALGGSGQVVGVVGEAGVGKSRLCLEFVERCRAKGIPVNDAHCPAHGKTIPFLPLLEMLRNFFGIGERDSDHEARRKIAGELALLRGEFGELVPLVFDLLGVADPERPSPNLTADARQQRLFAFVRQLIQARSEREPSVLLVDDLHWIDPGSDEFVAQAVEAVSGARTLLLLNFRPEYQANWAGKSYYQQLPLVPLGPDAIRELLEDLLGRDPSLSGLPERVQERTGGNPFFTEEVVQSLVESGHLRGTKGAYRLSRPVDEIEIPATVQPVLSARIDRLAEREKQVLQTAAVIGKNFAEPILEPVVELPRSDVAGALATLEGAEFIFQESLYPHAEYTFKHPLTHQVALESQLQERRRRIHASVARALETTYPEKLDEQAALLAHHWEEAGEALEAARWHRRAAEWAGTSNAVEANRHWERVRALVGDLPASVEVSALGVEACRHLLNLSWRLGQTREETRALYDEGRAHADRTGDPAAVAVLTIVYGRALNALGDMREPVELAPEAARLARESGDRSALAGSFVVLADSAAFAGDFREACTQAEAGLEGFSADRQVGSEVFGVSPYGICSVLRGWALHAMGRLEEAREELRRTEKIAVELDTPELETWAHLFQGFTAFRAGDATRALEEAQRTLDGTERLGNPAYMVAWAYKNLAAAHLAAERWEDAEEAARASLEIHRVRRAELSEEPAALAYLAEALLGAGNYSEAREIAEETVAASRRVLRRFSEIRGHLVLARALARIEGTAAASAIESALEASESLIEESGAQTLAPHLHEARAEIAKLLGDRATHERELREAHRLFVEMGATGHVERLAEEINR